jgi:hypothetical protein
MIAHLVFSKASKLHCYATYVSRDTCPPSCPLYRSGCYAEGIRVRTPWDRASTPVADGGTGVGVEMLSRQIRALPHGSRLRWGIAGDLLGEGEHIDEDAMSKIASAAQDAGCSAAWGYSHKLKLTGGIENILKVKALYRDYGFVVSASLHGIDAAADFKRRTDLPVVTVLPASHSKRGVAPKTAADGTPLVVCPAAIEGSKVTCGTCGGSKGPLCARFDREYIVGFPAHGISKKKAELTVIQ